MTIEYSFTHFNSNQKKSNVRFRVIFDHDDDDDQQTDQQNPIIEEEHFTQKEKSFNTLRENFKCVQHSSRGIHHFLSFLTNL